jgi:hypothetical protein
MVEVGPTPQSEEEFSVEWVTPIMMEYFKNLGEINPEEVKILAVKAKKNVLQGILSTTFVVDVEYSAPNEDGEIGIIYFISGDTKTGCSGCSGCSGCTASTPTKTGCSASSTY